jgi:hypothetical protein
VCHPIHTTNVDPTNAVINSKGLFTYNKGNGTNILSKNVQCDHANNIKYKNKGRRYVEGYLENLKLTLNIIFKESIFFNHDLILVNQVFLTSKKSIIEQFVFPTHLSQTSSNQFLVIITKHCKLSLPSLD